MGLYKRGLVWWMRFTYKGQQVRKSAKTTDKKLAEKIYHKAVNQIAEGKWFDVDEGNQRIFEELKDIEQRKHQYGQDFKANRFKMPMVELLRSVPGVGPVRAHAIAAYISTGHRFENKHKLWSYAQLIRHRDESDGYVLRKRTPHGRSELKSAFMGAAQRVIISPARTTSGTSRRRKR